MFARQLRGQLQAAAEERDYEAFKQVIHVLKEGIVSSGYEEDAVADNAYTPDLLIMAAEAAMEVAGVLSGKA